MAPAALADAAREWLSDVGIPTATQLMHLLRHTSGLRAYGSLPEYHRSSPRGSTVDA
jgi:CubicO group peptidase (beta-lactamase class C family)